VAHLTTLRAPVRWMDARCWEVPPVTVVTEHDVLENKSVKPLQCRARRIVGSVYRVVWMLLLDAQVAERV